MTPALRRRVWNHPRIALFACNRRNIDDPPIPTAPHVRNNLTAKVEDAA